MNFTRKEFREWLLSPKVKGGNKRRFRAANSCECPLACFLNSKFMTDTRFVSVTSETHKFASSTDGATIKEYGLPTWAREFVSAFDTWAYGLPSYKAERTYTAHRALKILDGVLE